MAVEGDRWVYYINTERKGLFRLKWGKGILGALILILMFGIVGNMEYRLEQRELEWQNSEQALLLEQEKIQNRIIDLQGQFDKIEDMYIQQGIHIDNIRTRLHLDFFEDLEAGVEW